MEVEFGLVAVTCVRCAQPPNIRCTLNMYGDRGIVMPCTETRQHETYGERRTTCMLVRARLGEW